MRIALIGYGSVGQAFARLLERQRRRFPFRITAIQTRQRTAYDPHGLPLEPAWGPPSPVGEFLDRAAPEVVIEITSLNPVDGEPAISHIRAAFARGLPVITANKGPIAHAYSALRAEAAARHILFRFESTVMDGSPVFNLVRNSLPGVAIDGTDARAVALAARQAVERARAGDGPSLIEARMHRFYGHSLGDMETYRTKEDVAELRRQFDPLSRLKGEFESAGLFDVATIEAVDAEIEREILDAVAFADGSPFPPPTALHDDVPSARASAEAGRG